MSVCVCVCVREREREYGRAYVRYGIMVAIIHWYKETRIVKRKGRKLVLDFSSSSTYSSSSAPTYFGQILCSGNK